MSEELNQTQIIQEFLKNVKSKLPGWLKDNKSELKDVMSELESHIWEKSEAIAAGQEVQNYHVRQAVQDMGNPRDIAAEYKKRGTPKLWISQELFSAYVKTFGIVVAVIVGVNLISVIVDAVTNGPSWDLLSYLDGIWSSALGAFLIVTVIFVALSVEGYLPEDFKKSGGKYQLKSTRPEKEDKVEGMERKWQEKRPKQVKPPLRRGELLAGGIITLLIGIAMFAEVWVYFPLVEDIGPQLTYYIRLMGVFTMIGGIINLMQSMMDLTNYTGQRILMGLHTIVDLASIPFTIRLLTQAVLTVPSIAAFEIANPELFASIALGFNVVTWISVVGTVIGSISNIYKIITLRMKFEEYHQYHEI
ncbi:MAG: hypothetical protein EU530_08895 [Promethearchaeota archaeon]|nr:MAG: hypothetical protein EU530_08895 [Candidatus Lokiarchaeota archaeon]